MTSRRPRSIAAGAVAATLALAGCSGDGADSDTAAKSVASSAQSSGTQTGSTTGTDDAETPAQDNGASSTGIDLKNPPKAIASVTLPPEADKKTTDTLVELVKFEERGKVLMAVFRVTPHGTKEKTSLWSAFQWAPRLVDLTNLKVYEHVKEVSHGFTQDLVMNEPNYVMAGFAIPEGTDTIDIGLNRVGMRMEGVKLP